MCGGVHYGEVEGLFSVERWSCSRGASCVVEYTIADYCRECLSSPPTPQIFSVAI